MFNRHVQVDFMFIGEMRNLPILHMVDTSTAFSVTLLMDTQEMEPVAREFDIHGGNVHGPPSKVSGDPEFDNEIFKSFLRTFSAEFQPRTARTHNKIGVCERKHDVVRTLTLRLLKDGEYFTMNRDAVFQFSEILSSASF